jgi:hypothetical protein
MPNPGPFVAPTGTLIAVETLASKRVCANLWMTVREDAIRRPDGSTGIYGVVDSPDIALIIPADGDRLHLVEQYRYPVAGRRWEFPSGSADQRLDVTRRRWPPASCASGQALWPTR